MGEVSRGGFVRGRRLTRGGSRRSYVSIPAVTGHSNIWGPGGPPTPVRQKLPKNYKKYILYEVSPDPLPPLSSHLFTAPTRPASLIFSHLTPTYSFLHGTIFICTVDETRRTHDRYFHVANIFSTKSIVLSVLFALNIVWFKVTMK